MALKIKLKRVSGVPTTSDLESGEVEQSILQTIKYTQTYLVQ